MGVLPLFFGNIQNSLMNFFKQRCECGCGCVSRWILFVGCRKKTSTHPRVCPVRSGPGARTSVRSGPVCCGATRLPCLSLVWFLLDRFWLPKIEKVIKFGWFNSFQFYISDLLVWWLWFLFDGFWLPKIEKVIKSAWFNSFQFYISDLLVWWLWFLFDGFWLPKIEKVIKSAWFNSFQLL